MTVNGILITPETILATRAHFIDIHQRCIQDAQSGETRVNDLDRYVKSENDHIAKLIAGEADNTLTFAQCALWLQTGDCVAILK